MNDLQQFEASALHHGWRIDMVDGKKHYVSNNGKGIAMVGPRARRRKGWSWPKRKATEGQAAVARALYWDGEAANPALVRIVQNEVSFLERVPRVNIKVSLPPAPPQKVGRFTKAKNWCVDRFYSPNWHYAVRQSALNVMLWALTAFTVLALVKGALWLISL